MLRSGNVYNIDDSQYVLLNLLDSNSIPGYLLASLNMLGTRLGEPCRHRRMENVLIHEQARLLGCLGRVYIADYIRGTMRSAPPQRPLRWGYVYENPYSLSLVQSVAQKDGIAYCTLLHFDLDWISWRGVIVKDSSLVSRHCIGYCGETNIWPHLEHFLDREDI